MALEINKNDFQEKVLEAKETVLVDFWAPWCGPCRMQAPVLEKFAEENPAVKVVKVNVDDNQELAMEYNIRQHSNMPQAFSQNPNPHESLSSPTVLRPTAMQMQLFRPG